MRAKRNAPGTPGDAVRGDIDALAQRIDTLAAMVRETSGALAATRGEVASTERRVGERLREDTARVGAALTQVRDELAALRARPTPASAPAAQPLTNELTVLADRVQTLSAMVAETAGRVASGEGTIASMRELVSGEGARVDQTLIEIKTEIAALARRVAAMPQHAAAQAAPDGRVDALGDRVSSLAEIVRETAGGLAAATGSMKGTGERIGKLEARLEESAATARQATAALEREVASLRIEFATDPAAGHRVDLLANQIQALGDRLDTVSSIVATATGQLAVREEIVENLERRLTLVSDHVAAVSQDLRQQIAPATATHAEPGSTGIDAAELDRRIEPIATALQRFTTDVGDAAEAVDRLVSDLRVELDVRIAEVEREQLAMRDELTTAVSALESESEVIHGRIDEVASVAHEALTRPLADLTPALDQLNAKLGSIEEERRSLHVRIEEIASVAHRALSRPVTDVTPELRELADKLQQIESDRGALERRIEDLTMVAGEARDLEITDATPLLRVMSAKLQLIESDRDALHERIDDLSRVANEALARPIVDPTPMLQELTAKLERIERERNATATELASAEAAWLAERAELRERLDEIANASLQPAAGADAERLVRELMMRLERIEREHASVTELASLADGWTQSLSVLAARVDHGLLKLDQQAESEGADTHAPPDTAELAEIADRVAAMEADRDAVVEQLARATETWAAERIALQERVSELAARIVTGPVGAAPGGDMQDGEDGPASVELDRLRIALEGMRMRLAYHEKNVSEMGAKSVVQRLDEMSARIDRLQRMVASGNAPIQWATSIPLPDADIGGLLSRVEEAERIARSGREDALQHLERVASRMDWRLQRLESEPATAD